MAQLAQNRLRNLVGIRPLALPRLGEALDDLALPAIGRQNSLVPEVPAHCGQTEGKADSVQVERPYYRATSTLDALAVLEEDPDDDPSDPGSNTLRKWRRGESNPGQPAHASAN